LTAVDGTLVMELEKAGKSIEEVESGSGGTLAKGTGNGPLRLCSGGVEEHLSLGDN